MEVQEKIDQQKLEMFLGKAVSDFGSAVSAALVLIGDKLGLYKAMAHGGPLTSAELARRTGTTERYVREWLVNQAAGGYIDYDAATGTYSLPHEHAIALADEKSPYFVGGGFQVITAMMKAEERIAQAFLSGDGMFWGEHDHNLFEGTERFFRPGYAAHLVASWIPALRGVKEKLERAAATEPPRSSWRLHTRSPVSSGSTIMRRPSTRRTVPATRRGSRIGWFSRSRGRPRFRPAPRTT
jgi:hypothetical protein